MGAMKVSKPEVKRWVKWLRAQGYNGPLAGLKPSFELVKRLAKELRKDPPTILETHPRDPRTIVSNLALYERRQRGRKRTAVLGQGLKGIDLLSQQRYLEHHDKLRKLLERLYNEVQPPDLRELCLITLEPGTKISYPYADIVPMIYDEGAIKLEVEYSDPFLWECLHEHLIAEFPRFDTALGDWRNEIVSIVNYCHCISNTIAAQLAKARFEAAEPFLSPDAKDYAPGVYHHRLTLSIYECVIANYEPRFERISGPRGLTHLVMEYPGGRIDVARGGSTLLGQLEKCCGAIVADDAIRKKVTQLLGLAGGLKDKQEAIREKLRPVLERGMFMGTCNICSCLASEIM